MDKSATAGYCPHCKNELNEGATACSACGAFETNAWAQLGVWRMSLLGGCFFVFPILSVVILGSFLPGGFFWILVLWPMVGYFVLRSKWKQKKVWATGGRRVV